MLIIFLSAFCIRLAYLFLIYGDASSLMIEDSKLYLKLAENILSNQSQSLDFNTLFPSTEDMPLYPLFISGVFSLFGKSEICLVLSQIIIDSMTCVLIALIAKEFDRCIFLLTGVFAACNPTQIVISSIILTDTIFLFFVTIAFLTLIKCAKKISWIYLILLAIALALGIMTRAVLMPWAIFVTVYLLFLTTRYQRHFKNYLIILFSIFLCLLILSPQLERNYTYYGTFQLVDKTGNHYLNWVVPMIRQMNEGISHSRAAAENHQLLAQDPNYTSSKNPFEKSDIQMMYAVEKMKQMGPLTVAQAWILGGSINLFSPAISLSPPFKNLTHKGLYEIEGSNRYEKIWNFLFKNENTTYSRVFLFSLIVTVLVRLIQVYGLSALLVRPGFLRHAGALFLIWIAYVLLVNGPIGSPKYRLPLEPMLLIFLSIAFTNFISRRLKKKK